MCYMLKMKKNNGFYFGKKFMMVHFEERLTTRKNRPKYRKNTIFWTL